MKIQVKTVSVTLAAGALISGLVGVAIVHFGAFDVAADVPHSQPMLALMNATRSRSVEVRARGIQVPKLDDPQLVLKGAGQLLTGNIVCPLHRWTYDGDGKLLGAPHFPEQPCLNLPRKTLQKWNGMLFQGPRDIAADLGRLGCAKDLDFAAHVLNKVEVTEYNFNWKTFIEVYLEDYHVEPFHPGLGKFVDCDKLEWEFGHWYSVQTVGVNNALTRPGTETYKKWHDMVLKFRAGIAPSKGAIWLTYYPNIMVEWYPHVLVISTIVPRGPEQCTNIVEFYYPEEIALFEPEFIAAEQHAYDETALEDEEICQRMNDGRKLLWQEGRDEQGPYQSPMEDGMVHFHEFLRRELGAGGSVIKR